MADSSAVRVRRSRLHKSGDHSLCHPARCMVLEAEAQAPELSPAGATEHDERLGERGSDLWRAMVADGPLPPLQSALLVEACRIVDRLDRMDRQLGGRDWLRFRHTESGVEVTVHVDRLLAEAREQATALKNIVGELRQSGVGKPVQKPQTKGASGGIADLAARIAERRAATAG